MRPGNMDVTRWSIDHALPNVNKRSHRRRFLWAPLFIVRWCKVRISIEAPSNPKIYSIDLWCKICLFLYSIDRPINPSNIKTDNIYLSQPGPPWPWNTYPSRSFFHILPILVAPFSYVEFFFLDTGIIVGEDHQYVSCQAQKSEVKIVAEENRYRDEEQC